jgi:hypothetical protein
MSFLKRDYSQSFDDFVISSSQSYESTSPIPCKRIKLSKEDFDFQILEEIKPEFRFSLKITNEISCGIKLTSTSLENIPEYITNIFENHKNLKINDFCSQSLIKETKETLHFEVNGTVLDDLFKIFYLKGLIARKSEAAVISIPNSEYQLFIYDSETSENKPKLQAIITKKFNIVFDLDETLVKTRLKRDDEIFVKKPNLYQINVKDTTYICAFRKDIHPLMKWATSIFNVYIYTNSVYEYAIEVLKIIDPMKEHLLKEEENIKNILKTRVDMNRVEHIQEPLGEKSLNISNLDEYRSVILDDDENVWKTDDRKNLLPFERITKNMDFFLNLRGHIWKKFQELKELETNINKNF